MTSLNQSQTKTLRRSSTATGFSESLQHYIKMGNANCADYSIYGVQVGLQFVLLITTAPAANYNPATT